MRGRAYYVCRVRLDGDDSLVIWYSDEPDGFVYDAAGTLLSARTVEDLAGIAIDRGISLAFDVVAEYDFDRIMEWCSQPNADGVACPAFLNAWNFLDDLAGLHQNPGTPYAELSRAAAHSYDKLFWGSNLPSVTPPGERFDPSWAPQELEEIRRVMESGLALLRERLRAN